jgi:hypothetical protein
MQSTAPSDRHKALGYHRHLKLSVSFGLFAFGSLTSCRGSRAVYFFDLGLKTHTWSDPTPSLMWLPTTMRVPLGCQQWPEQKKLTLSKTPGPGKESLSVEFMSKRNTLVFVSFMDAGCRDSGSARLPQYTILSPFGTRLACAATLRSGNRSSHFPTNFGSSAIFVDRSGSKTFASGSETMIQMLRSLKMKGKTIGQMRCEDRTSRRTQQTNEADFQYHSVSFSALYLASRSPCICCKVYASCSTRSTVGLGSLYEQACLWHAYR